MATTQSLCIHADDDCIEMELSSTSNFICYSNSSPPRSREFEFQMSSVSHGREATTSPADELFYKGKLLPLHLPPRLLMVQKLLQNPATTTLNCKKESAFEENYVIPFTTSFTAPSTNINTPLESCNISPSESCRVSSELNPDEYFFEWPKEANCFLGDHQKKSWTKKLKQSSLGLKLKASRAYLKSLFKMSGCTDESCNAEDETISNGQDCLNKYMKVPKKSPFGNIDNDRCRISNTLKRSFEKEMAEDGFRCQRRSFSGAIQWHSATKSSSFSFSSTSSSGLSSSSSSFSFSSNGFCDLQLLKRSGCSNSEFESSITEAIAHCKRSHQLFSSRKSSSEVGFCSLSASVIAARGDQETPRLRSI
ncbi:PREDICTED: probable membrane-associated kinase regulator 4 [Populus euphratica]|uniref:Probable membrane-associated kinase regulator 4 n=1 Tax=Populus euphratica TaxID=75702 RepID=A0AAJ6TB64_POPEU|nr:PREDICTED: probable membrane-associated kinase regulator 4 [Populus euphratica]